MTRQPHVDPPGWYADPAPGSVLLRFWDGQRWTDATASPPVPPRAVTPWRIVGLVLLSIVYGAMAGGVVNNLLKADSATAQHRVNVALVLAVIGVAAAVFAWQLIRRMARLSAVGVPEARSRTGRKVAAVSVAVAATFAVVIIVLGQLFPNNPWRHTDRAIEHSVVFSGV